VLFPSQFLLKLTWYGQEPRYLNPFDGEFVSRATLRAWLVGHDGPYAQLKPNDLASADNPEVLGRWLALMKAAWLREERYELALACSNVALSFVPDDPIEIRDRGYIYQQLDCEQLAAEDYQYFIDNCPDDPSVELLRLQVQLLNRRPTTIH